jgi:CheY-like chemotaxis protein
VVEAVPSLRLVFHDALAEMGYVTALASSLEHALRLLHQHPFDLIVADTSYTAHLQDALAPLRPLLTLSHPVPVVLCTPLPLSEPEVRQAGFAGWVQHPFTLDQLVTSVAECLHQPWSPAQRLQAEVVQRGVAAFIQGDAAAVVALCTEEVRFYPWIVPPYPSARPVVRRAAVQVYVEELMQYLGAYQAEGVQLYPCPHGVAIRLLLRWQDPAGAWKQQMWGCCVKVASDHQVRQIGLPQPHERLLAPLRPVPGASPAPRPGP